MGEEEWVIAVGEGVEEGRREGGGGGRGRGGHPEVTSTPRVDARAEGGGVQVKMGAWLGKGKP